MVLRTSLACCALVACRGSERSEDQRAPAQAPIAPPVAAADAAPPDAAAARCFAVPFDASAEQAGIRRLAHDARQPLPALRERVRGVTKLAIGVPTRVPGLKPRKEEGVQFRVPDLGADALVSMAKIKGSQVELTAPEHLAGAVLEITGDTKALVAIGDPGLATLVRYRNDYVKARIAKAPKAGDDAVDRVEPIAVFSADIDGDGTAELISYSVVGSPSPPPGPSGLGMLRAAEMELGVLWASGEIAFARLCCDTTPFALYLAPPTLSGGRPLVFALNGDRFAIDTKGITALPRLSPSGGLCLQTSATEPAQLVVKP